MGDEGGTGVKIKAPDLSLLVVPVAGEGYAGRAAQEKRLVKIKHLNGSEELLRRSPLLAQEGFLTYFGQPLLPRVRSWGYWRFLTGSLLNLTLEALKKDTRR